MHNYVQDLLRGRDLQYGLSLMTSADAENSIEMEPAVSLLDLQADLDSGDEQAWEAARARNRNRGKADATRETTNSRGRPGTLPSPRERPSAWILFVWLG